MRGLRECLDEEVEVEVEVEGVGAHATKGGSGRPLNWNLVPSASSSSWPINLVDKIEESTLQMYMNSYGNTGMGRPPAEQL